MKSYEEMTASVLERGKIERKNRKRKAAAGWSVACACLCLALVAVLGPGKAEPNVPAQQVATQPRVGIMLLSSESDPQPKMLVRDVSEPFHYLIRVLETKGLNDEEVKALMAQERAYAESLWSPEGARRRFTCYGGKTAVISIMSAGRLMLSVDDYRFIKDFTVTTTETGYVGEYVHRTAGENQGIAFGWILSQSVIDQIEADPTVKLSTFSDTITICVEFQDGTTETVIADVVIQDDGQVFIVHRGAKAMA